VRWGNLNAAMQGMYPQQDVPGEGCVVVQRVACRAVPGRRPERYA